KRVPDTGPGRRVTGAGAHTASRNASPSTTRGGSRMRESRPYGSVRGALSNGNYPPPPHGSLDHARAEFALRGVVGVDFAGIVAKGQKLVSRAPDFGLQFPSEVASGRRGQKSFELFFQFSFL